uniref:(northern house mosquito) hypothetical protein n=1 Tax=Culex pipiens TaxID=7175 RepID=A0A8D8IFC8_CULPI
MLLVFLRRPSNGALVFFHPHINHRFGFVHVAPVEQPTAVSGMVPCYIEGSRTSVVYVVGLVQDAAVTPGRVLRTSYRERPSGVTYCDVDLRILLLLDHRQGKRVINIFEPLIQGR